MPVRREVLLFCCTFNVMVALPEPRDADRAIQGTLLEEFQRQPDPAVRVTPGAEAAFPRLSEAAEREYRHENVAVTDRAALITKFAGLAVPVRSPVHPVNEYPGEAEAVSWTALPAG
jgi:hypothetical protein